MTLNIIKDKLEELPNNIEAEQSVIGSILLSNEIFDEISILISSKNFYDPMHQKIFSAIESLIYKGMLANPITLKNHFENQKDELNIPEYLIKNKSILFHGENLGLKNDFKRSILECFKGRIIKRNQEEIIKNQDILFEDILNISLFDEKKIFCQKKNFSK